MYHDVPGRRHILLSSGSIKDDILDNSSDRWDIELWVGKAGGTDERDVW